MKAKHIIFISVILIFLFIYLLFKRRKMTTIGILPGVDPVKLPIDPKIKPIDTGAGNTYHITPIAENNYQVELRIHGIIPQLPTTKTTQQLQKLIQNNSNSLFVLHKYPTTPYRSFIQAQNFLEDNQASFKII